MRSKVGSKPNESIAEKNKKVPFRGLFLSRVRVDLDANDVVGSFPFLFFFQLKVDCISLRKNIAEARALHIAFVKKHFVAFFGNDKAKTLRHIKKLHSTVIHRIPTSRIHERVKKKPQREYPTGVVQNKRD